MAAKLQAYCYFCRNSQFLIQIEGCLEESKFLLVETPKLSREIYDCKNSIKIWSYYQIEIQKCHILVIHLDSGENRLLQIGKIYSGGPSKK